MDDLDLNNQRLKEIFKNYNGLSCADVSAAVLDLFNTFTSLQHFEHAERSCELTIRKIILAKSVNSLLLSLYNDSLTLKQHPKYIELLKRNSLEEAKKIIDTTPCDASLSPIEIEQFDYFYKHFFEEIIINPILMDYRTKEIISNPSTIAQIPPQDKFYYKKITFTNSDRQIPSADTVFSFFQKVV